MKNIAVVTGASSGIGEAIANRLLKENFEVFGIARSFDKDVKFNKIECNLSNIDEIKKISKKISNINILVNCAGFGEFRPHEEISLETIDNMIDLNLKAPILLTKIFLRDLKNSAKNKKIAHIINITSIEALRHSKFSALYTATKSGLRDFSLSLFEELRKSGVRVTSINPDITDTNFFDNLNFSCNKDELYSINPKEIAEFVIEIIDSKSVITDFTIRPQKLSIIKKHKIR